MAHPEGALSMPLVPVAGSWSWGAPRRVCGVAVNWGPPPLKPPSLCPTAPPMLYPNLAELEDYMGLALSSEEIQKKLFPDSSTVGVRAGAPTCWVPGPPQTQQTPPGGVPSRSHILPGAGARCPQRV